MKKEKKKKKVHPLCRGRDVLETEGLSPWGERHSVTVGNQMYVWSCSSRWFEERTSLVAGVWLGVAIRWNCVGFKLAPGFDYGVQVVDGINMHF